MSSLIEIELNAKVENDFLKNLNYQICKKYGFYTKLPEFHQKLKELNYKINKKETLIILRNNFESKRRRDIYKVILNELDELIKDHTSKN
ncbi:MAG: hypothetical protein EU539_00015 [Promethearchaeota archaeon]|nr:MAG: hypothetical protein EU539_00015 [Candidatus Lokiarchaeota archaeon]